LIQIKAARRLKFFNATLELEASGGAAPVPHGG
jgi:hypothetical protein